MIASRKSPLLAPLLALLAADPAAASEPCAPTAVLRGPAAPVEQLALALRARGVRVEPAGLPPGPCGVLHVSLAESEGGLHVWIGDPWGRTAERTVKDPLTAAALVESWARLELLEGVAGAGALPEGGPPPVTPPAPAPPPPAAPAAPPPPPEPSVAPLPPAAPAPPAAAPPPPAATASVAARAPATPAADQTSAILALLSAEAGAGRDRTRWIGASASGCARVGFTCLGATARYSINRSRQSAVDLLLDLSAPIALGALTITPGVGVGGGWIGRSRSSSFDGCSAATCGSEPPEAPELSRGTRREGLHSSRMFGGRDAWDDQDATDEGQRLGLRAEARLIASLRLAGSLHLQIGGAATAMPDRDFSIDRRTPAIVRGSAGLLWGTP